MSAISWFMQEHRACAAGDGSDGGGQSVLGTYLWTWTFVIMKLSVHLDILALFSFRSVCLSPPFGPSSKQAGNSKSLWLSCRHALKHTYSNKTSLLFLGGWGGGGGGGGRRRRGGGGGGRGGDPFNILGQTAYTAGYVLYSCVQLFHHTGRQPTFYCPHWCRSVGRSLVYFSCCNG